jgi:hypothetical protein
MLLLKPSSPEAKYQDRSAASASSMARSAPSRGKWTKDLRNNTDWSVSEIQQLTGLHFVLSDEQLEEIERQAAEAKFDLESAHLWRIDFADGYRAAETGNINLTYVLVLHLNRMLSS